MKTESKWLEFIEDWGDGIGGVGIGFAIGTGQFGYGIFGVSCILIALYLKFYHKKHENNIPK